MAVRVTSLIYETAGRRLIDNLELELPRRGISVIMGANGAGKSTLVRLLHGLIAATGGRIEWLDRQAATAANRAMVMQKPVILRRSVAANIAHAVKPLRLGREESRRRVEAALRQANLVGRGEMPARRLSAGEQQRLAFARAMARQPAVVFADEPCANLDPAAAAAVEAMIADARERGVKVILVTHDVAQGRRLGDDVAFMHAGRVVEHSSAEAFFRQSRSAAARAYLEGKLFVEEEETPC